MGEGDELVPFHKLTGWTTYSLIEPIEKILGWRFDGLEDMTGLPEYRNGACMWSRVAPRRLWSPLLTHLLMFSSSRSVFLFWPVGWLDDGYVYHG